MRFKRKIKASSAPKESSEFIAFRYRLVVSRTQEAELLRWMGSLRWVWNWALAQRQACYKAFGFSPTCEEQCSLFKDMKLYRFWIKDIPSQALQEELARLYGAFRDFYSGKSEYPQFKRKAKTPYLSLRFPVAPAFLGRSLYIPKLGHVRVKLSRPLVGTLKNFTVSYQDGEFWVSIVCERPAAKTLPVLREPVGLDLGIAQSVTASYGSHVDFPVATLEERNRLAFFQRRLCRCVKGSYQFRKWKERIGRLYRTVRNRVHDFRHKFTTTLVKNHDLVVVEGLKIQNMSASAKGTAAEPGSRVRQKAGLNRSILAEGWSETVRQLGYKLAWKGGVLIKVDPRHSSQECNSCGSVDSGNRLYQAVFGCLACGHSANADVNAAKVLLKRGLLAIRRGLSPVTECGDTGARGSVCEAFTCLDVSPVRG